MKTKGLWLKIIVLAAMAISLVFVLSQNQLVISQNNKPGTFNFNKGSAYEQREKYDSAIYYLELASREYLSQHNEYAYLNCLIKLGNSYKSQNVSLSERYINTADSLLQINYSPSDPLYTELFHVKGSILLIKGNKPEAAKFLRKSVRLKISLNGINDTNLAVSYNNLGNYHLSLQNLDSANHFFSLALEAAKKKRSKRNTLLPKFKENLAMVYGEKGDYTKTRQYFEEALEDKIAVFGHKSTEVGKSYANLGNLELKLSNYAAALEYLNKAENVYIDARGPDFQGLDDVYLNKGKAYTAYGNNERALNFYNKSLQILRGKSLKHPKIGEVQMNIGWVYFLKNDYKKSIGFYNQSLEFIGGTTAEIKAYRNLGKCYRKLGNGAEAQKYLEHSIHLAETLLGKSNPEAALGYSNIGELLIDNNQFEKGLENYKKAIAIYTDAFGVKNRDIAYCQILIGDYYQKTDQPELALHQYQDALGILLPNYKDSDPYSTPKTILDNPEFYLLLAFEKKAQTFFTLWQNHKRNKDLVASYNNYIILGSAIEKIRNTYTSEKDNEWVSGTMHETIIAAVHTMVTLYNATNNKKYLADAFSFSEKSKSALLIKALKDNEDQANGKIPTSYMLREKKMKSQMDDLKKLLFDEQALASPSQKKIESLNNDLFLAEKEYERFNDELKAKFPSYYAQKFVNNSLEINDLKKQLKNEVVLEYTLFKDIIYIFGITSDTFFVTSSKTGDSLENAITTLLQSLRGGMMEDEIKSLNNFAISSYDLYELLIKPVEKVIQQRKIIVIPDGILGYIPFETLIKKKPVLSKPDYKAFEYLMKTNCIRYAYLSSYISDQPNSRRKASKTMLGFAPVHFENFNDPLLKPLPLSEEEIIQTAKIAHGDTYIAKMATESNFKKQAGQYKILHIATHTQLDTLNPEYSKVLFYRDNDSLEDNQLNTFEISGLSLNARLAVLSGCNTGTGKLLQGEGVFNLARGFIYAGVPSIVMTLWEIEDNPGAEIMTAFYTNLKDGMPTDEALWKAKLHYLENSDILNAHPYFWSTFVSIGKSETIALNDHNWWFIAVAIGLCVITIGIVLLRKKAKSL
jgi:CHAT domain-containing protein/Tfp pilus assembly protein PilF